RGRVAVAALLDADEVLDADAGERRQLRPPEAGDPAPRPPGEADRLRRGGVALRTDEVTERRTHGGHCTGTPGRPAGRKVAVRGPPSPRSGCRGPAGGG